MLSKLVMFMTKSVELEGGAASEDETPPAEGKKGAKAKDDESSKDDSSAKDDSSSKDDAPPADDSKGG